ncbi:mercuric ion transport protein [Rhizobiales bacterium GAS191]|jgi:mercuric ion transport protein|nr:mercuric ion transport protein [Rhizobiales bacterium GAS188]SEE53734.1 mercuric ion transport protein [Rhizobiales bacterium GAS191]
MRLRDNTTVLPDTAPTPPQRHLDGAALLSAGGILAALGAATCCVVPFALFFAGVSGAWIGNLTALKPYQPVFVGIAVACLCGGCFAVYRKSKTVDCVEGSYCARPSSNRIAKLGLWTATILIIIAVGFPYVARFFLDA